ncbi:hypothetical protein UFOVP1007_49 [uncultured Caudovirales phage]|uniref:Uncharacterized protein n=1 Tax=uncultured Caudovirales phage TaxID=2100421 RepID=A0A6J5QSR4_9CAUD|nr:hypothetical protein UFOVP927_14 [uncultured Caudovirales phage]CAB4178284.1 hypothetical protein UFOVP1007_49 [uncultured Caudovirales phage]CAB4187603.1 hypothetical protein UFOVP1159_49 [uncultured Caudovirales phage]
MNRLHLLTCIQNAERSGFLHFAAIARAKGA